MTNATCAGCGSSVSEADLMVRFNTILEDYTSTPGALIPLLQIAQNLFGYLPEAVLKRIAERLDKPYSEIAGVVSFYSFFTTTPRGKNLVRVCLGTACYVRGGKEVLDSLKKLLKIDVGQTTEDRQFSLEIGRCFGACGLAPVIMVNEDVHQRVKPSKINAILETYRDSSNIGKGNN